MALFTLYFNLLTSNEFRGPHFNNCDQMHLRSKLPKTEWFAMPNTCNSKTKSQDYKYVITTTKLQSECLEIHFHICTKYSLVADWRRDDYAPCQTIYKS